MRGTFGNIRLANELAGGINGGVTRHMPDGEQMSIYEAAMRYQQEETPLIVIGGKEYGTGSSRDWAAKGTARWASRRSSLKALSVSTGPTSLAWVCRRCNSKKVSAVKALPDGTEQFDITASMAASLRG